MKLTKTELKQLIREELTQLNEASEVEFHELDKSDQKIVQQLSKVLNLKPETFWDGLHGRIVMFPSNQQIGEYRFDIKEIKGLAKLPIRWVEADRKYVNIGF